MKLFFGVNLELNPVICFLECIRDENIKNNKHMAIIRCLFLAQKLIARKWLAINPLIHREWIKEVDEVDKANCGTHIKNNDIDYSSRAASSHTEVTSCASLFQRVAS